MEREAGREGGSWKCRFDTSFLPIDTDHTCIYADLFGRVSICVCVLGCVCGCVLNTVIHTQIHINTNINTHTRAFGDDIPPPGELGIWVNIFSPGASTRLFWHFSLRLLMLLKGMLALNSYFHLKAIFLKKKNVLFSFENLHCPATFFRHGL